jgi:hypothetical protein
MSNMGGMISNVTGIGIPQITDQGAECLLELLTHHNTSLSYIGLGVSISFSSILLSENHHHHHCHHHYHYYY